MWTVSSWASFISPPPAFEINSLTCTGVRWAIQKIGLPSCSMAEDDHLKMKMFSSTETFVHCLKKFPICCLLLAFILLLYGEFPCLFIIWAVMISDFHDYFGQNNTWVILKYCKFEKTKQTKNNNSSMSQVIVCFVRLFGKSMTFKYECREVESL